MKQLLLSTILFFSVTLAKTQTNSTKVVSHNKLTIVTNPAAGTKSFKKWAVFPSKNKEIRRIVMNVSLAHPDSIAIAHWDYMDRINILRTGGAKGKSIGYEIGRMLTPYGSNFKKDWSFTWSADVTDFASFLQDSVEIEYVHSGYESPKQGWALTIDFDIVFGPPVADFISVKKLWDASFDYGNPDIDIEKKLSAIEIDRAEGSSFGRFRIQHTGHGMDKPKGCSEFCSRWRKVKFDGKTVDYRDMWKECGNNPLYPQGGTWIFDRAYWCPGDLQQADIIDIPLTKAKHLIDIDMEPYTATENIQAREVITSYFFQYAAPNNKNDAAIEEIIVPNNKKNFNRMNPAGFNPKIKIRNLGSNNLKSLKIKYKTIGFKEKTHIWKGNIAFYEAVIITLPGEILANGGLNTFSVSLEKPNGKKDGWKGDNKLSAAFEKTPTIPCKFVIDLLTNNKPKENSLYIVDHLSDTLYKRTPGMLDSATNYRDTLNLPEGNYYLMLTDTAGDGLEFWFMPEAGYGHLRLKDLNGNFIKLFESDCGNGQFYSFRCSKEAVLDTTIEHLSVNIYPRYVKDKLTIYTTTDKTSTLKVRITKDGAYIEQHEYANIKDSATGMDFSHLEKGRYVMEIYIDGEHKMNRRFNKR